MLRVTQQELSTILPKVSFYAAVNPLEAEYAYRSGLIPLYYLPSFRMQMLSIFPYAPKVPQALISKKNPDFAKAIKTHTKAAYEINAVGDVDAVVDVSGFAYSDTWGTGGFEYAWPWLEYCQSKQKPYVFLPQAWGPFEKEDVANWAKKICKASTLLFSRDDESSNYLAKLQGISAAEVRQAPDTAFCFRGANKTAGEHVLKSLGIIKDRPLIGIVPNIRVYERTVGEGAANEYVKLLVALANHCIETLNADVLISPNEIKVPGNSSSDDRFLCSIVSSHIQKAEHCFNLCEYYPSEIIKSVLGHLDFLIASRFHSLVFALSQGVPVIALGWSHKYHELLRSFELENYVVDYKRLNTAEVISLVDKGWQQRYSTKEKINNTVPQIQKKIKNIFDEIASLISEAKH